MQLSPSFNPFIALQEWMKANTNVDGVSAMLKQIQTGEKKVVPTVISFKREVTGDIKMIEPDDALTRGVIGLKDGQLGSQQFALFYGIQLRAAYHATVAINTNALLRAATFSYLESITNNGGLPNGFFDFEINNKGQIKEHSMTVFANQNTDGLKGYYPLAAPNLVGKPNESLKFECNGLPTISEKVAFALDLYAITTV